MFELTVAEQRIVIVLLLTAIGIAIVVEYRERANDQRAPESFAEPSPSAGTFP